MAVFHNNGTLLQTLRGLCQNQMSINVANITTLTQLAPGSPASPTFPTICQEEMGKIVSDNFSTSTYPANRKVTR